MADPADRTSSLSDQLRWVHDMLRRDLATVRQLAAAAADGAAPEDVRSGLDALQSNGALFRLRVNCLGYCRVVHAHHGIEDAVMFPAARESAPGLTDAIDRLEADHRTVARLLDQVAAHAADLEHGTAARRALVVTLTDLSGHLLEHLAVEEATLAPILDAWSDHPERAPAEIRAHL